MLVRSRGDSLAFSLNLASPESGQAFLRTNLGRAEIRRREIIDRVEKDKPVMKADWRDLPMPETAPGHFELTVPLAEVGRFQAKAFFEPERPEAPLLWAEGADVTVKVEPADYVCSSAIYSAFVRQFGKGKEGTEDPGELSGVRKLDAAGYAVIPPSGKFRDVIRELDFITGTLGFRIIQLLPVFPTPTTYARMGRFGSPFAALDFMDVDPALAEFDQTTTPLDQFRELADAVHARSAQLFIDIPINHTGWASWLQNHHPEWFARNADATFESPGAWGVTWADLSKLDYAQRDLWKYIAEVFLFWCEQGVDGFRCDAGYMVPPPVWQYVVAKVRAQYPDTVFFLEGLGGPLKTVNLLLDEANLDWAYSELFQTESRDSLMHLLPEWTGGSLRRGIEVHFAETHDNNRMAERSPGYAEMRTALAALASVNGAYGITAGVEWFATVKIRVHGAEPLAWGAERNQVAAIQRLNTLLACHPAFHDGASVGVINAWSGQPGIEVLGFVRHGADGKDPLLVLVNLTTDKETTGVWERGDFEVLGGEARDLLLEDATTEGPQPPVKIGSENDGRFLACPLAPGQVRVLSLDAGRAADLHASLASGVLLREPGRALAQRLKAAAMDVRSWFDGESEASPEDLARDPNAFCAALAGTLRPPVLQWRWETDCRRVVTVPADWALLASAGIPFIAALADATGRVVARVRSLPLADESGGHFALVPPCRTPGHYRLAMTVFENDGPRHASGAVYAAPDLSAALAATNGDRQNYALCTNGRGAMAHARGGWSEIRTQYDALLAANLHPDFPCDRRMLLARCRAWVVYRDYSREINADCQTGFGLSEDGSVWWKFDIPVGGGRGIPFLIRLRLIPNTNTLRLIFARADVGAESNGHLADDLPVRLVVRPDLDDRSFHEKTKAFAGPERNWPGQIAVESEGFSFHPGAPGFSMHTDVGGFFREDEWFYNVGHPVDAQRGLGASSDLFSPGYFAFPLAGGAHATLSAGVLPLAPMAPGEDHPDAPELGDLSIAEASRLAIRDYIVKRDDSLTVIAGYPWFLDWGRDTLICLRGIIAAGMRSEARDILTQFARFEQNGTLPNMIRGGDDSNRDTSDAPLWFFVALDDLLRAEKSDSFLDSTVAGRSILQVILSLGRNYRDGTPNGIRMDPESALIFSPSHYTWMDTNHPAGTPRQGYPIEIQALWFAALNLLHRVDPNGGWAALGAKVRESIHARFLPPGQSFLSDCLHAAPGQPASEAQADDHLRPNQLFAITLGAVDDPMVGAGILDACEELLIPGAIRSLADRPVTVPLAVYRDGVLLNNPHAPYWGYYAGDEDTRRKPAYHNGTAWTWPFPSYPEALVRVYGDEVLPAARALMAGAAIPFNKGCLGHLPEILDADAPHTERGCGAQAWGATEFYRVAALLGG